MWQHEYTAETQLESAAVWKVLADLDRWADWDTSMEWVRLEGPLAVGAKVTMKPSGQDPIESVITELVENEKYADECHFNGLRLRFSHTLMPRNGGTVVTHRLDIDGPDADAVAGEIGPQIVEDFPEAMTALLAQAAL